METVSLKKKRACLPESSDKTKKETKQRTTVVKKRETQICHLYKFSFPLVEGAPRVIIFFCGEEKRINTRSNQEYSTLFFGRIPRYEMG